MTQPVFENAVARTLQPFGESIFTTMSRMAIEHGAINLSQGFPDFDGPDWLKQAACDAIWAGPNQYAPAPGNPALRAALAAKAERDYGLKYDPDTEITVLSGATEAIAAVMLGMLNPEDEVILFEPFYDGYPATVAMAGAKAICLPLIAPDYNLDIAKLEALVNPNTRAILLNSPCNPSGKVFTREELMQLQQLMLRHPHLTMITDEVYEHIIFGDSVHIPFATLEGMRDRTILISSFSKTLSMTGWKVGYIYAPAHLTKAVRSSHQFLTFCAASPLQAALSTVMDRLPGYFPDFAAEYLQRRDLFLELLSDAGFQVKVPQGTYFVVVDAADFGYQDGFEFCKHITQNLKVAAIPAKAFYRTPKVGDSLVRFAFCKGFDTLKEAGKRLKQLKKV
jgi:N-succinyldiaminopimelate aminotransferase